MPNALNQGMWNVVFNNAAGVYAQQVNPAQAANQIPQPPQEQIAQEQVQGQAINQMWVDDPLAMIEYEKAMAMIDKKDKKSKVDRSASRLYDEFRSLASRTVKLQGLIRSEQAELANVLDQISTQVEVVRDIGSTIQDHISSLQKDANLLEKLMQKLPQLDLQRIERELAEDRSVPAQAAQPALAAELQAELGLWQQDLG